MKNTLFGKDIASVDSLTKRDIELIFKKTKEMEKLVQSKGGDDRLKGKILAALFYEPSSRTFSSFISAMQRLGGGVIPLNGMSNTSVFKGETLEDTVRVFSSYADVLVIRHPQPKSLETAAKYATIPVINAGEGAVGEHPTQALIDIFTVSQMLGKIEGLHCLIIGDLAHYRPTNSLLKLLTNFKNIKLTLATPKQIPIIDSIRQYLIRKNMNFTEKVEFESDLANADVLYVTRVKKEYMSEKLYLEVKGSYRVTQTMVSKMKKRSLVMHCLPRVDEIDIKVDSDPRSVYLKDQVRNGLYLRMALLDLILRK